MRSRSLAAMAAICLIVCALITVPRISRAINGTFRITSTSVEKPLVQQAGQLIVNQVLNNSSLFDACMADAFLADDKGLPIERILGLIREPQDTAILCDSNQTYECGGGHAWNGCGSACSGLGGPSEALRLSHQFVCGSKDGLTCPTPATIAAIAGVILHETAHNKTFDHDNPDTAFEGIMSVNNQLKRCMQGGGAVTRSSLTREVQLAQLGGPGGSPGASSCGNGFVTGLHIGFDSSVVRSIVPMCKNIAQTSSSSAPAIGNPGGQVKDSICGADSFVTGLTGRNGNLVDSLGVQCSTLTQIVNRAPSNTAPGMPFGGGGGFPAHRTCPAGMAVAGFQGRSGAALDQLRPICRAIAVGDEPVETPTPVSGRTDGFHDENRCTGSAAVVGLYGRSGKYVDRVGAICQQIVKTSRSAPFLQADVSTQHATSAGIEPTGGGQRFVDQCSLGRAVVGISTRAGDNLDNITGICANMDKWVAGVGDTQALPARGGSGGQPRDLMCPFREFVVGFETWVEVGPTGNLCSNSTYTTVRGIRPVCRRLPLLDLRATLTINRVGSGQVNAASFSCGPTCSPALPLGTSEKLQAIPATMWGFDHWEGACSGSSTTCSIGPLVGDQSVKAVFVPAPQRATLTLKAVNSCSAPGGGTVTSTPSLIACSADDTCTASVPLGTSLTLSATPGGNTVFTAFSGDCVSSTTSCTLTVDSNKTVTAEFCGRIP